MPSCWVTLGRRKTRTEKSPKGECHVVVSIYTLAASKRIALMEGEIGKEKTEEIKGHVEWGHKQSRGGLGIYLNQNH